MKTRHQWLWLSRAVNVGLILVVGASVSACSNSWKEEVQLSDGRTIVVERETIREGGGDEWASNRGGSKPKEARIRFSNPDGSGKVVEWRSTKIDTQTWPEMPLIFDITSGKPTVYSLVAISLGCEVYSKYVYKNGGWIEELLPQQFEQRTTNLLFGSQRNLPEFVDFEEKRRRNGADYYRKSLTQVGPNYKVCTY